jgi:hypothetical protein
MGPPGKFSLTQAALFHGSGYREPRVCWVWKSGQPTFLPGELRNLMLFFAGGVGARSAVRDRFVSLAEDAGRLLRGLPAGLLDGVPQASWDAENPLNSWVWTCFDLAWANPNTPGLHTTRMTWHAEKGFEFSFGTDPRTDPFMRQLFERNNFQFPATPPDYFYSVLADGFRASVSAIDIFLSRGGQDGEGAGKGAANKPGRKATVRRPKRERRTIPTERESRATELRSRGFTGPQIAHEMNITPGRVSQLLKSGAKRSGPPSRSIDLSKADPLMDHDGTAPKSKKRTRRPRDE